MIPLFRTHGKAKPIPKDFLEQLFKRRRSAWRELVHRVYRLPPADKKEKK